MSQYDDTTDARRQPIKVAHLVFGIFFLGIAALWALTQSGTLTWKGTSYLVPVLLLIAGAVGLGASLLSARTQRRPRAIPSDHDDTEDDE